MAAEYIRTGNTLSNILDSNTGEYVTYNKVTEYADGTPMDDSKCDGVIYRKLGDEYFVDTEFNTTKTISLKRFGAKCDGITDDAEAFQKALYTAGAVGRCNIDLGGNTCRINSDIYLRSPNVNIKGGRILNRKLIIGDSSRKTYDTTISSVTFQGPDSGIVLLNTRRVYINHCIFNRTTIAIKASELSSEFHANAQIDVSKNTFTEIDYCLYIDSTHSRWDVNSDWTFEGNIVNICYVSHIHVDYGIDGLKVANNVFFGVGEENAVRAENMINILYQSAWLVFTGNNFFQSSKHTIALQNPKEAIISGNNFAWCGAKEPSDCIYIYGNMLDTQRKLNISSNNIERFSRNMVTLDGRWDGTLTCEANSVRFSATNFPQYEGTVDLTTIPHYIVSANELAKVNEDNDLDVEWNQYLTARVKRGTIIGGSTKNKVLYYSEDYGDHRITINSADGVPLFKLSNNSGLTGSYSGEITIVARISNTTDASNESLYRLAVNKRSSTFDADIIELSRQGFVFANNYNQPGFYFYITDDILYIAPAGSAILVQQQNFYIAYHSTGNIKLSK